MTAALYGVDVAQLQVKIAEGALWPTLALQGSVQQQAFSNILTPNLFLGTVALNLSVPIYQGGAEYSAIRLNKETEGQQRLNVNQVRDQTQANVVQSWGQLQAAKAQVEAAIRQNDAAERALEGVRNEAQAGQRTTLDVLNAEQALVNARVSLIVAQHDRVVASYSSGIGGRPSIGAGAASAGIDLRSDGALPAGARRLVRPAHAGRPLSVPRLAIRGFQEHAATTAPYWRG